MYKFIKPQHSCDDAPALEIALHKELKDMQLNKINPRKEFFKVDIDTIISAVSKRAIKQ
ncbi:GIY-YIG nuclease family protein [Photobacterium carnosum]|uniref:GIY-YIG nuclease family protein n=1 Tax=Photobacterium carnosum TaxID=2023717 RepID=UPI001E34BD64|nr:hypothetical protein [Photobacterium carnosum]